MPFAVTEEVSLPDEALEERFIRASGPGGQNVNKVATAVQLRLDLSRSGLSGDVLGRLTAIAGSRLTDQGVIVIDARAHRTQKQNREGARERLALLIRRALVRPKRRQKTRPGAGAVQRRIDSKKHRGATKRKRTERPSDD